MKVDIITMHRVTNYGSILQTYATFNYLKQIGCNVEIIDYIAPRFTNKYVFSYVNPRRNKSIAHRIIYIVLCFPGRLIHKAIFSNFIKKNLKLTKRKYYSIEELRNNIPEADIYLTGSDQVWNNSFEGKVDKAYFLDFVPESKKKVAYAASFGKKSLDKWEINDVKILLKKYDKISVRENSGLDILNSIGISNSHQVLDPTLLLSKEQWNERTPNRLVRDKYVLIYQLNSNKNLINYADKIASKLGIKVVKFGWDYVKPKGVDINLKYRKPQDFLSAIKYAEFIVTDSFHGTIFALNFNKQFVSISPPKYSGRLVSILSEFDLLNRMVSGELKLDEILKEINYSDINKRLEILRRDSRAFLKELVEIK